jgi:hypothetical protein
MFKALKSVYIPTNNAGVLMAWLSHQIIVSSLASVILDVLVEMAHCGFIWVPQAVLTSNNFPQLIGQLEILLQEFSTLTVCSLSHPYRFV